MATSFMMFSGDSKILEISIADEDGVALDVSSAQEVTFRLAIRGGATVFDKTLIDGIAVAADVVTVTIAPADTAALSGTYLIELQITDSGDNVFTALQGNAVIEEDLIS